MRTLLYIVLGFCLTILYSCTSPESYRTYGASVDSLGGAISTLESQLKAVNEVELSDMRRRYVSYKGFIKQHVTDTLTQPETLDLQRFDEAGRQLEIFSANRESLASRAQLLNDQLLALRKDIRTKSVSAERLREFVSNEKEAAKEFTDLGRQELEKYLQATKQFRISVTAVGNMIRKRNGGELPRVVEKPDL